MILREKILIIAVFVIISVSHVHAECDNSTCPNGGVCKNGKCECPSKFFGANCTDKCAGCINGGKCEKDGSCSCHQGYYGDNCEIKCSRKETCHNHGRCFFPHGTCECDDCYTGLSCEKKIETEACSKFLKSHTSKPKVDPSDKDINFWLLAGGGIFVGFLLMIVMLLLITRVASTRLKRMSIPSFRRIKSKVRDTFEKNEKPSYIKVSKSKKELVKAQDREEGMIEMEDIDIKGLQDDGYESEEVVVEMSNSFKDNRIQ